MKKYIFILALAILIIPAATLAESPPVHSQGIPAADKGEITIGAIAPDFKLPNADEQEITLYELLEDGPVILSFYRGGWCPYCDEQLFSYQKKLPEFEKYGAQLVAISPEKAKYGHEIVQKNELTFEVLSDLGNKVARDYDLIWTVPDDSLEKFSKWLKDTTGQGLEEFNGIDTNELPIPATFVIDQNKMIVYQFKNEDYKKRAANKEILDALKKLEN